jgi:hypothetical protein
MKGIALVHDPLVQAHQEIKERLPALARDLFTFQVM